MGEMEKTGGLPTEQGKVMKTAAGQLKKTWVYQETKGKKKKGVQEYCRSVRGQEHGEKRKKKVCRGGDGAQPFGKN